jgi:uncharacterized membrane protein YfcA
VSDWSASAAGLGVGFLVGMTGMGGGALMAPVLILLLGVRPLYAVGTDLAYAAIAKAFGAWQHHRLGHVDYSVVWAMAIGSVPGSLLGVALLTAAHERLGADVDRVVLHLLGIVLILVAAVVLARGILADRSEAPSQPTAPAPPGSAASGGPPTTRRWLLPLAGAVIGLVVGLTSVGSGSLVVAFLGVFTALTPRRLVGTDVLHGALLSAVAGLAHAGVGDVDWPLVGQLLIGAVPGVLIGSRLTGILPQRAVRSAIALVLLVTGVRLL